MTNVVELECGRVYKFPYHGKMRLALVLDDYGNSYNCWDFASNGYRTFSDWDIEFGQLEDVTDKALIKDGDQRERFGYRDVRSCYHDGKTYVVRF